MPFYYWLAIAFGLYIAFRIGYWKAGEDERRKRRRGIQRQNEMLPRAWRQRKETNK